MKFFEGKQVALWGEKAVKKNEDALWWQKVQVTMETETV